VAAAKIHYCCGPIAIGPYISGDFVGVDGNQPVVFGVFGSHFSYALTILK